MDLSSPAATPEVSWTLFWTITQLVALAVLATEALFLLRRARTDSAEGTPASRFVWVATPALLLAGLSLWCLFALPSPRGTKAGAAQAAAQASWTLHR